MRILKASDHPNRSIEKFSSIGFHLGRAGTSLHAVVVRLEPGGTIGRHPTSAHQALLPILGAAEVAGDEKDGQARTVGAGEIVLWRRGESHVTSTQDGLTAVILEGDDLFDLDTEPT